MFCRSNGISVCISCGTVLMAIGCPMFSSIAVKRPYSSLTETHSSIGKRAQSPAAVIAAISASAMFSLISKPSAPNGISPVVKPFASASSTTCFHSGCGSIDCSFAFPIICSSICTVSHVSRHSPYVNTFISITSQPSYERTKPEPPAADGSSDVRWQIGMPPYCLPGLFRRRS